MSEKILLVDDNAENLLSLELQLNDYPEKLEVVKAQSGAQALDIFEREPISVALIDVRMPEIDGYELCRRIRSRDRVPYTPVLLITGQALETENCLEGFEAGCDDYIMKPIRQEELFARLKSLIRTRKRQEDLRRERDNLDHTVKERQETLCLSDQRFRCALRNSNITVFSQDLDLRYTWIYNPHTDLPDTSVLGKTDADLVASNDAKQLTEIKRRVIETGKGVQKIVEFTVNDTPQFCDLVVEPLYDASGTITGITGVSTDITGRKTADEKLKRAEDKIRHFEKIQAIGQLAAGIAHDFNNILGAIVGYSELILNTLPKNSRAKRSVNKILKACNRAKRLINQILMFSRQRTKKKRPIHLYSIVNEVVELIRATLPPSIKIKSTIEEDSHPVLADPTNIHEVIMNLCTNAAHAVGAKGLIEIGLTEVSVATPLDGCIGTLEPGRYSRIMVKDTGYGIDELALSRIFEPFFTTKEQGEGTGMGLSVVYGIMQSHNGNIIVESKPDHGTTFYMYLPLHLPQIQDTLVAENDDEGALPEGTERILFVDDD